MSTDYSNLSEGELDDLLTDLEQAAKEASRVYVPYDKQKQFHVAPNKIRALFGGNRSGKTECGTNEARFHATGIYPEWYPVDKRWTGATRGRVVVQDFKKALGEVVWPKIQQWFDPELIIKIEKSMGNVVKLFIRHVSGGVSTVDIMTYEQDTAFFEGWSGHWVWFDEPPPRDKYIACLRGMIDFGGRMWITATPIAEPWMFDEIVLNVERDAWHEVVSSYDNPFIPASEIKELEISLTDEEKEARIRGKFIHLTGRIYPDLDTNVHLVERCAEGWLHWPIYFVLDPADRRPHHGIWAVVDPMGTITVFDEIVFHGTIKDTCAQILVRERTAGIQSDNVIRILDPNKGKTPSLVTGLRLVDEFATHGLYFTATVNDDLALGHLAVREKLAYDKKQAVSTTNFPKLLFVRDRTRECIKQLLSYVWDDWRGRNNANKSQKEVPKDINKDMPDCVRYLCMSNPTWANDDSPKTYFSGGGRTGYGP